MEIMAKIYAELINKGLKTLEEVPSAIQQQVIAIIMT